MQKLDPAKALSKQNVMDHLDFINTHLRNMAYGPAGLAIGTSSTAKVKIVNTVPFTSSGAWKSKTTAEVAFTATAHDIAANASVIQEAQFLLTLDAAGAPTLTMGAIAAGGASLLPERPASGTVIGSVKIAVAAGATKFTASTDALSAGHLTVTYTDLAFLSPRFDAAL